MRKPVRRRHGDSVKYVVCVLWLIGYSERMIASVLSLRPKQVAGIVTRSEYGGRSGMSDQIRAEKLKELESVRIEDGVSLDGGMLDRVPFVIKPIGASTAAVAVRRLLK